MCWKRGQGMGGRKPALTARESGSRMGMRDSECGRMLLRFGVSVDKD
jgi:hypothetical protein